MTEMVVCLGILLDWNIVNWLFHVLLLFDLCCLLVVFLYSICYLY